MPDAPKLLIQVVPRMMPGRCGLSDPALLLANDLKIAFGIGSAFVVLNSAARADLSQPIVYCTAARLLENCLHLAGHAPAAVLIHLSGYGYSPDGAPADLAVALAALRASGRFQIAVFFHELFAGASFWPPALRQSLRQRKVLRAILSQSDLLVTNLCAHAGWIERNAQGSPVHLLPVFSTIGEAPALRPVAARKPALAVFGLPPSRQRAYRELPRLKQTLGRLNIEEIIDAGIGCGAPRELFGLPVRCIGEQPAEALRDLFSNVKFGLVAMPSFCLAKSSIFASLCAQGTVPLLTQPFTGEVDGLRDGTHALSARSIDALLDSGIDSHLDSRLEACSQSAWQWYGDHRLRVHSRLYAGWLGMPAIETSAQAVATAAHSA